MKKPLIYFLIIIIIIIFTFIIKIPEYVELNDLMIVDSIGLECTKNNYKLYLKEVIPTKDDNGINYKYKIISSDNVKSIDKAYNMIEEKSKKKIFYKDTKYLITNCTKSEKALTYFDIDPNYIKHTKRDIKKELK